MKLCTLNVCSLSPSALMHVRPLAVVLTLLLTSSVNVNTAKDGCVLMDYLPLADEVKILFL